MIMLFSPCIVVVFGKDGFYKLTNSTRTHRSIETIGIFYMYIETQFHIHKHHIHAFACVIPFLTALFDPV